MFSQKITEVRAFLREKYPFSLALAGLIGLIVFYGRTITQNFQYLFVLLPFLLAVSPSEWKRLTENWVLRAFAAYLASLWLSLVWNGHSSVGTLAYFARHLLVELSFVSFVAWHLSRNRRDNEVKIGLSFGIVAFVACVLALWHFRSQIGIAGQRMSLMTWSNPNTGAAVAGAAAMLLVNSWFQCRQFALRVAITAIFAVLVVAMILSESRATLAAVLVSLVACVAAQRSWKGLWTFATVVTVVGAAGTVTGAIEPLQLLARGDSTRFAVWYSFSHLILENIWSGVGIDVQFAYSFNIGGMRIDNPHNMFLVSLLYGGILSLLAWITLFAVMTWVAYFRARDSADVLALSLVCFLFVHGLFEGILLVELTNWQWLYFLLPLGCIAGVALSDAEIRRSAPTSDEPIGEPASRCCRRKNEA